MSALLDRLTPRIKNTADRIRAGGQHGLCFQLYCARVAGEITLDEQAAVQAAIDAYMRDSQFFFAVSNLLPEFYRMRSDPYSKFPNAVSLQAADLWEAWAINIVQQAETTDAVCTTTKDS